MPSQVRLFVSAGPDLEPARELLGLALAEMPVNVGWVIKRTPDVDSVPECHLFLLLLGADITAPVGLELWWARRTEKPILAYAIGSLRTPAGQVFLQENAGLGWTPPLPPQRMPPQRLPADGPTLRRAVSSDLSRFLLVHADRYGVTLAEAERLHAFIASLEKPTPLPSAPPKAAGAGGGGVILAPGKDQPPGARLIGEE